jgi:hypothetical protein
VLSFGITRDGRYRAGAIFLAVAWHVMFGFLCCAETSEGLANFSMRSWNTRDGLPTGEITALARTPSLTRCVRLRAERHLPARNRPNRGGDPPKISRITAAKGIGKHGFIVLRRAPSSAQGKINAKPLNG